MAADTVFTNKTNLASLIAIGIAGGAHGTPQRLNRMTARCGSISTAV
jgi:hypothetical protein